MDQVMQIEMIRVADLTPYEKNPRKNDAAVNAVAASIKDFGFRVPLVIDKDNIVVCGHTRLKAAKKLGLEEVPCIKADNLTEDQIRAYRIIDNKTQEISGWDYEKLDEELDAIMESIDMSPYGFNLDPEDDQTMGSIGDQDLDNSTEIDLSEYSDDNFECECPVCGFRFTEG
jgi:site-specific DNA-methyltransferase (adenine-specific)